VTPQESDEPVPSGLKGYLEWLGRHPEAQHGPIREAFQKSIWEGTKFDPRLLWASSRAKVRSYFALLQTLATQDVELARSLLWWRESSAADAASVRCLVQGRDEFEIVRTACGVVELPCLLVSGTPEIGSHVCVGRGVLLRLASSQDDVTRFLSEVHNLVVDDPTLERLKQAVLQKMLLGGLEVFLDRARGFITGSVSLPKGG
jgi:hypothetical protein